jgi:hypothetical protein
MSRGNRSEAEGILGGDYIPAFGLGFEIRFCIYYNENGGL